MQPILLKPVGKDSLWGGDRLKTEYYKQIDMYPLAETWECSAHPDGPSIIASGEFKGETLDKVLLAHPEFLGSKVTDGQLPILVKFIDATQKLSVQVHPDDEYALLHENQKGKTEMWYVLEAKPDAKIVYGFQHDVTAEQLKKSLADGSLMKHLQVVNVKKGDVFFIPAKTIHAIGAGMLIAEIQESSNLTYRVYDYDRVDKHGNKRELHFEKALDMMNMRAQANYRRRPKRINYYPGCSRELLCKGQYFETEHIVARAGFSFSVLKASFQVLLCIDGFGSVETFSGEPLRFKKGDCIFLPANTGRCYVKGQVELLKIRC